MHWLFIDNQPTQGLYYATALFHNILQARQTWLPLHNILTSETEYTGRTLYHEGCGDISVSVVGVSMVIWYFHTARHGTWLCATQKIKLNDILKAIFNDDI